MSRKRKVHPPEFKAKVSLAAIKALKTTSELASQYQVHPVQISTWKKQAIESLPEAFQRGKPAKRPLTEGNYPPPLTRLSTQDHRKAFPSPQARTVVDSFLTT